MSQQYTFTGTDVFCTFKTTLMNMFTFTMEKLSRDKCCL